MRFTSWPRRHRRHPRAGVRYRRPHPLLAITAHTIKGDRERCLESGMGGYITKPVKPVELFEAIESACHPA